MRNVIIPAEAQEDAVNLCDVSMDDLIVAYSGKRAIGFVICNDNEWVIQTDSDVNHITGTWHNTLAELARIERNTWPNFSLKVL